nr:serine dehydratase subunit alpha family protein [Propionibacterium sp.]
MDQPTQDAFEALLLREVIPALGCTEPIAIALATAKARAVLGVLPEQTTVLCSGNIIKNAASVIVPNSHGLAGIQIAAALGLVGGDPDAGLEALQHITPADIERARALVDDQAITVRLVEDIEGLYILAQVRAGADEATVELRDDHTLFRSITRNGRPLPARDTAGEPAPETEPRPPAPDEDAAPEPELTMASILRFAAAVDLDARPRLRATLRRQVEANMAIAEEGLRGHYGASVGRTLLEFNDNTVTKVRARALAAAGADARMGGSSMPVMINSGSGNQGMTVSIPVVVYARDLGASEDDLHRALLVSNLVGIYQKQYIGRLSAFCGVVTAAAAAGAGIARLLGLSAEQIDATVVNTIATTGGMVCDGAKASCASKISIAVENAVSAVQLAQRGIVFDPCQGIVGRNADETIRNVGAMASKGMRSTDVEILNILLARQRTP